MYSWPRYQAYFDGTAKLPPSAVTRTTEISR